ncbi:hypothetical protein KAR48_07685 [bacterium]|nr:hypothetical protein [bacterium]
MFRIFILAMLGYMGFKFFKNLTVKSPDSSVKGENAHKPLDLSEQDVADAQYEDMGDNK